MSYQVSRLGDTSDHGGQIVTASPTFKVGGIPVARIGDILDCPQHGKNPIVSSLITQKQGGVILAHVGSKTECGATITTGSATYNVG
jgi:uncharacterized Zn-binding protein involved in type VI secretion